MAKMTWDNTGERYYKTGVSEVALFPMKTAAEMAQDDTTVAGYTPYAKGVPWNGVTSIEENPDGGDANDFYADNIKYLSLRAVEDFGATITAYQSPEEFDACDGVASLATGIKIAQQVRRPFGLVWKTQIGNDVDGIDHGYELHVVYNATASPSSKNYETVNDSPEPAELSWDMETTPIAVTGYKPTSHLVISSLKATKAKLDALEAILYGSTNAEPKLLLPDDVIAELA